MGRAPCCEKVGLKRGRWTAEEDRLLINHIKAHGEGSWRSLPKNAGLLRCGKSCRLRWINYLRADIKRGNISEEEEATILKLRADLGNRWSLIASHLPGRTDNEIKNYWNSHLCKKARQEAFPLDFATNDSPDKSATNLVKMKRAMGSETTINTNNKKGRKKKRNKSNTEKGTNAIAVEVDKASPTMQEPHDDGPMHGTTTSNNDETSAYTWDVDHCDGSDLHEMVNALEELVHECIGQGTHSGASSTFTEEYYQSMVVAQEACSEGNKSLKGKEPKDGEIDFHLGLENIPWEEDGDVWQWLCDGGDLNMDLDLEAQVNKLPEDLLGNNLESWLFS